MKKTSFLLSMVSSMFLILSAHAEVALVPQSEVNQPIGVTPEGSDSVGPGLNPRPVPEIPCSKATANVKLLEIDKNRALDEYHKQKKNSIDILGDLCSTYRDMNDLAYDVSHAKDDRDRFCNNHARGVLGATPPLLTCDPLCEAFNAQRKLPGTANARWSQMSCEEAKKRVENAESQKVEVSENYYRKKHKSGSVVEKMCKQYQIVNRLSVEISRAKDIRRSACDNSESSFYGGTPVSQMYDPFCQVVVAPSFTNVRGSGPVYRYPEDRDISSDGSQGSEGGATQ